MQMFTSLSTVHEILIFHSSPTHIHEYLLMFTKTSHPFIKYNQKVLDINLYKNFSVLNSKKLSSNLAGVLPTPILL